MPHVKFKPGRCSNCNTQLFVTHEYCPQCGQINHSLNIPLKHLLAEAAEGVFHFDTKSVLTLNAICFKPGFLTAEFMRGRRVRYVAPVRFYIFISFIFFLVISLPQASQGTSPNVDMKVDAITFLNISSADLRGLTQQAQLDSAMHTHAIPPTTLNRYIVRQLSRIGREGQEGFNHMLLKGVSYMMFVLMPLFAAVIFILHRKKAMHYIGTLVFSIHYHSFVFLILTLAFIVDRIIDVSIIFFIPIVLSPIYLLLALRRVYGDSFLRTLMKTTVIGISQIVSMVIVFILTVFVVLLLF